MKKILALFLAMLMALTGAATLAEEWEGGADDTLVVGFTTALSGSFFTEMWGDNTSDIDVRMLLHGYNLMEWESAFGTYTSNKAAVRELTSADDDQGNRTYTIALKENLAYSDGTPITARDYAFSMLLCAAPQMAQIGAKTTASDAILGVDAYKSGAAQGVSGVRILGDYQLAITVKADYEPFFYETALLDVCPYPIHVIAPGCEVADDGEGAYIRNIDGAGDPLFTADLLRETVLNAETGYLSHPAAVSGPYKLVSFDWETRTAVFEINEYYKGNSDGVLPSIPRLVLRTVSNDTMAEDLASGKVDLLHKCVRADNIDQGLALVAQGGFKKTDYPRTGYSFIGFCCEQDAVSSAAVRRAIAYCLDKDALVKSYVGGYGETVDGYYGIGQWVYQVVSGELKPVVNAPSDYAPDAETEKRDALNARVAALNLDGLATYALDLDAAAALLEEDGWTLNRDGQTYEGDGVRCKQIGGAIVPLELTMIYPEGNAIGEALQSTFVDNLAQVGVELKLEAVEMTKLLDIYYRNEDRSCDMIYLATNFATVFDPSETFNPSDAYQGAYNRTAIADEQLYQLAVAMRQTEPGDILTYCERWVAFQERFTEVLPAIPVYSNNYYDFYTSALKNYDVAGNLTWSQAVVGAKLAK